MGACIGKGKDNYVVHVERPSSTDTFNSIELTPTAINVQLKAPLKLTRGKSSSNVNKISPMTEEPKKLKVSRSTGNLRSKESSKCKIVCSLQHPWLIKDTVNFEKSSLNDYEFGRVLGTGAMGTVSLAWSKGENKYLAFKSILKKDVVKHNDGRHVLNEKNILNALNCSFCVKLFGTFQDKNYIYFGMQYVPGGELFRRLEQKSHFTPEVAKFYISELFLAIERIQAMGFCYRDLKPENVLIDEEGHCKLVDFGLATVVNRETGRMHTTCGTPAYQSPEQLDGKHTKGYTSVIDWWSFGILLFELLTGSTPFCPNNEHANHYAIYLRILKGHIKFPWFFDKHAKNLITQLCNHKIDLRLTTPDDIKNHAFFNNLPWESVAERKLIPPFVPILDRPGDVHYFKSNGAYKQGPIVGVGYAFKNEMFDF